MKRAMIAAICLGGALAAGAETNYVLNPGFETGTFAAWSSFASGWYIGTGGDAQHGTYGAVNQINLGDTDEYRGILQEFAVQSNEMYSASAWIRAVAVESTRSFLEIQWLDASGSLVGQHHSVAVTNSQPFAPVRIEAVVPPANAVTASVRLISHMQSSPTSDPDWHIFDTISFFRHRSQLVTNRSFEAGAFPPWEHYGEGWYLGTGWDAHHGTYGAANVVNPSDSDEWRVVHQRVPVLPGSYYRGGAYIRAVSVDTTKSYLELQFFDTDGNVIDTHQSSHVTADQAFQFHSVGPVLAPANAVTASVRGVVHRPVGYPPPNPDYHIFDLFMFEDVTLTHPLLENWGFETADFSGWNTFGTGWTVTTGAAVYANQYGARLVVNPGDSDTWRGVFQNIAVTAGLTYAAGTYIRAASVDSSKSFLEIQWFDINGSMISQTQSAHVVADQPFQRVMLTLVAPAGAATASVRGIVQMLSAPPNPNIHYFDEFFFLRPVDLAMSISATTNYAEAGVHIVYTVTVSNRSPSMSGAYFVTNLFPSGLTLVDATPGSITSASSVWWEIFGLPAGSTTSLTMTLMQPFTGSTQLIHNVIQSSVSSLVGDPISANNSTTVTTVTVGVPILTWVGLLVLMAAVGAALYRRLARAAAV